VKKWLLAMSLVVISAAAAVIGIAASAFAAGPAKLPANWHVHDCNNPAGATEPACGFDVNGDWHLGIGFFPAILHPGLSATAAQAAYAEDPARCPNATDKAFLPQGRQDEQSLRAGVCMTSSAVIHLRTVPAGTSGPEGWSSITAASEPGWVTYYRVTSA